MNTEAAAKAIMALRTVSWATMGEVESKLAATTGATVRVRSSSICWRSERPSPKSSARTLVRTRRLRLPVRWTRASGWPRAAMRSWTWVWLTGWAKVMSRTEPLVKSMPGRRPEPPVIQPPGGAKRERRPGRIIRAEKRKYQPRLPTMSYIVCVTSLRRGGRGRGRRRWRRCGCRQ